MTSDASRNGSGVRARVAVDVMPKAGLADPQGLTVQRALPALGWEGVLGVRVGKHLELEVSGESLDAIRADVERMCERFLANTVIESYEITVDPA